MQKSTKEKMENPSVNFFTHITNRDVFAGLVRDIFLKRLFRRTRKECKGCSILHYFPNHSNATVDPLRNPNINFLNTDHVCNGKGVYWAFGEFVEEEWSSMMDNLGVVFEESYNSIMAEFPEIKCIDPHMKFCCFKPWMIPYLSTNISK